MACYEAGHPVPDEDSFRATAVVLELTRDLLPTDTVLLLLSGGGSALFEQLLIPAEELQDITRQLLASGADIVEMNTIRKQLSRVKGGRFALHCAPARVEAVVLSDILGDPLDMIASGPAAADPSTAEQARAIAEKYALKLSETAWACLDVETPKALDNVRTQIIGSVRELCRAAAERCRELGYEPILLTDRLDCEAREAGRFLTAILRTHAGEGRRLAFLAGGETVVHLTGRGLGGRNQELALSAAPGIAGMSGAAVFSLGSDGTDGPTDAAGGYVDGSTAQALREQGVDFCTGKVATGEAFMVRGERTNWVAKTFSPALCEMEGGAIAQVCLRNGVKFTALKTVSDRLCQENNANEYFHYGEAMAKLNGVVAPFARALRDAAGRPPRGSGEV